MDLPQPTTASSTAVPVMSTIIVNGAGVLAEQPVIQTAPPPTRLIPPSQRRRLIEGSLLFLCAILFLRTMAVEPFGVPTGSMAPALVGNHKTVQCPRCFYQVTVGEPSNKAQGYPMTYCPNCNLPDLNLAVAREVSGDRLLVDKTVYQIRGPRRWEVAVFICPSDKSKPYVKRVVGLPGELLTIREGDAWADNQLLRKTLGEALQCRIPVYDGDCFPPEGWERRWLPVGMLPRLTPVQEPLPEWFKYQGDEVSVAAEGSVAPHLAAYWHIDAETGQVEIIRDGFEYNGHTPGTHNHPVHDFLFSTEIEPNAGNGMIVCSLFDGADEVTAHLAVGGEFGESKLMIPEKGLVRTANRPPLKIGKKAHLEMALVDRRVTVAVNGTEYFTFDLPAGVKRTDVSSPVKIGCQGVNATFRHLKLYRDIYYRPTGTNGTARPLTLGENEYFMLGDNSANSDDSRSWQIPGVPRRNFLGKPFLLHQPSRPAVWAVGGRRVELQSVDWGRIHWLR
ncbi:S26 family signal peptidase [Zavarzinella formosa]|uniref:S26 family signal peptidase n=1 Tax=Zavarzinella formosa TaxID=360055 RepID=UPI000301FBE2|nr:S26 family signal peptidase [Zavarzinella formosa]